MRVAPEIILTDEERAELMKLVRSRLTSVRLEQRAGIVLLAADGFQNKDIAQMLGIGRVQVARWRQPGRADHAHLPFDGQMRTQFHCHVTQPLRVVSPALFRKIRRHSPDAFGHSLQNAKSPAWCGA